MTFKNDSRWNSFHLVFSATNWYWKLYFRKIMTYLVAGTSWIRKWHEFFSTEFQIVDSSNKSSNYRIVEHYKWYDVMWVFHPCSFNKLPKFHFRRCSISLTPLLFTLSKRTLFSTIEMNLGSYTRIKNTMTFVLYKLESYVFKNVELFNTWNTKRVSRQ